MASEPEPVAWYWIARDEMSQWPVWEMSRKRPHGAPDSAVPLYDAAALLAAERRGRDAERERCARREIMDGDTILFASGPHDQGTVEHNLPDLSKEYLDDPPDLAPESRF